MFERLMNASKAVNVGHSAEARQGSRQGSSVGRRAAVSSAIDSWIQRHENTALLAAMTTVVGFSLLFAWREPFWMDEYLGLRTAEVGSIRGVWDLLKTAPLSVDPPLYHFLTMYCVRLFGRTEFVMRLPSVLAYTLMSFLLYRFVRKYADVYTGLAVVTLCLGCGTFFKAHEARPYALMLAASAMALICWANSAEKQRNRNVTLLFLFVAVSTAVGVHWLGFIVLIPLALGEAVRSWETREIDAAVWLTLTLGAATVLAYLPLLRAAAEYRAMPWKDAELGDVYTAYLFVIEPCVVPLIFVMVVLAVRWLSVDTSGSSLRPSIPKPISACIVLLALSPFAGFLVGKFVTHSFHARYALLCTIGLVIIVSLCIRYAAGEKAIWALLAVLILSGCTVVLRYSQFSALPRGGTESNLAGTTLFSSEPLLPIVISDMDLFLRMDAHGPPAVRIRSVYLTDPTSIQILHHNTEFLYTKALRRWSLLPITDLLPFLDTHRHFYVVGEMTGPRDWIVRWLLQHGADLRFRGMYAGTPVYRVEVEVQQVR